MRIQKFYVKDIRKQIGASPIWPVSERFSLGDYGFYQKRTGKFSLRGNIFEDLGVPRDGVVLKSNHEPVRLFKFFNSSNTTTNTFKADAELPEVKGSLSLSFSGNRSYVFQLFGAEVTHLKLNDKVKKKLQQAVREGKWEYRYRIIEMIYECPDVRFAFSLSKTADIKLGGMVADGRSLARGTVNYGIQSSANMDGSIWIENAPSTPFVNLASFKRKELKIQDEKVLLSEDWHLQVDASSSFDDEPEEY